MLGAVVRLEPRWEALPSDLPAPVRTLLHQCLVKDRRRRVGDIAAVIFVLDHLAGVAPTVPMASRSNRTAWLTAALAVIAIAVVALRTSRSAAVAIDPVQFTIAPPKKAVFGGPAGGGTGNNAQLAISPDGRQIAFVAGAPSLPAPPDRARARSSTTFSTRQSGNGSRTHARCRATTTRSMASNTFTKSSASISRRLAGTAARTQPRTSASTTPSAISSPRRHSRSSGTTSLVASASTSRVAGARSARERASSRRSCTSCPTSR